MFVLIVEMHLVTHWIGNGEGYNKVYFLKYVLNN